MGRRNADGVVEWDAAAEPANFARGTRLVFDSTVVRFGAEELTRALAASGGWYRWDCCRDVRQELETLAQTAPFGGAARCLLESAQVEQGGDCLADYLKQDSAVFLREESVIFLAGTLNRLRDLGALLPRTAPHGAPGRYLVCWGLSWQPQNVTLRPAEEACRAAFAADAPSRIKKQRLRPGPDLLHWYRSRRPCLLRVRRPGGRLVCELWLSELEDAGMGGSCGWMFRSAKLPGRLLKLYRYEDASASRQEKLSALCGICGLEPGPGRSGVALPRLLVYRCCGAAEQLAGAAVPEFAGIPLARLRAMQPGQLTEAQRRAIRPGGLLQRLAPLLLALHGMDAVMTDLSASNLLLDAQGAVCICDADSMQLCGWAGAEMREEYRHWELFEGGQLRPMGGSLCPIRYEEHALAALLCELAMEQSPVKEKGQLIYYGGPMTPEERNRWQALDPRRRAAFREALSRSGSPAFPTVGFWQELIPPEE